MRISVTATLTGLARSVPSSSTSMIHIARVLCPIDFSEFSRRALDHAAAIAGWYGAGLTVLHVVPIRAAMDVPVTPMTDQERPQKISDVGRFIGYLPSTIAVDCQVHEASDIHREILRHAKSLPADLLVMGSHGRSGFERLLLGSVTERLIRQAPCPTMVVPRAAPDVPVDEPVQFRRILCPVDFSDVSVRALAYAMSLAGEGRAQVTLLHVIEVPPELRANPLAEGFDVDKVRAAADTDALKRLSELVPAFAGSCSMKTVVREGSPYREILKTAAARAADLIVMGVRGRGAMDLMLFGSNTARVSRAATCPVLIVSR
jgi:nucleotide-binding universal stress UspA family protein